MELTDTNSNNFYIRKTEYGDMAFYINELARYCHGSSNAAGWWPKDKSTVNVGEKLMLIVSEVAEAMEGDRKVLQDDHLPHHKMITAELGDALIRIFDLAGGLGLPIGEAFAEKFHYNQTRADHRLENRAKEGGKKY